MLLTGDIGGTYTRLELSTLYQDSLPPILSEQFLSAHYTSLESAITTFLDKHHYCVANITCAALAVAGPVQQGKVNLTNLSWNVSEEKLQHFLKTTQVSLTNDFVASAYGIKKLLTTDYVTLQSGEPRNNSHRLLLGAGTGLGVALVYCSNDQYNVTPTEGGHHDFAPINKEQIGLFQYLKQTLKRVSIERVLSGDGLINLYHYLKATKYSSKTVHPVIKKALTTNTLSAEIISTVAINDRDPLALKAITLFVELYGQTAGNLALITLPYNGLFITGGIAPKLLSFFQDDTFLSAFINKGRMSNLLKSIPIYLVTNTRIGLSGAANYAKQKWDVPQTVQLLPHG